MSLPVEEVVADLSNSGKPLLHSRLVDLSNLNREELGLFERGWMAIEPKRRHQIICRLVELAEDNLELNFDSIFISCLKDPDAEIRSKAIEGLWESEDTCLITPLVELLDKDSSEKVQAAAAIALGKFALLAELGKLRSCHATKVCQALLAVVGDKSRPMEVRCRALEAVAPLSLSEVNEAISEAYQSHDIKLKASAIYAMGKNCNSSWLSVLLKELASSNVEMRYEAATACGELEAKEAVPYLIRLVSDEDIEVQLAAIQALGKMGGSEAKECLEQCLYHPDEAIQQGAKEALRELEMAEEPFSFRI